jgi:hypothetical protein
MYVYQGKYIVGRKNYPYQIRSAIKTFSNKELLYLLFFLVIIFIRGVIYQNEVKYEQCNCNYRKYK